MEPSQLQVVRNYQNAARSAGGQVLYDSPEATTFRVTKSGNEAWFSISVGNQPSGVPIMMVVIEKEGMKQDVTLDAKALATTSARLAGLLFTVSSSTPVSPNSSPSPLQR